MRKYQSPAAACLKCKNNLDKQGKLLLKPQLRDTCSTYFRIIPQTERRGGELSTRI